MFSIQGKIISGVDIFHGRLALHVKFHHGASDFFPLNSLWTSEYLCVCVGGGYQFSTKI